MSLSIRHQRQSPPAHPHNRIWGLGCRSQCSCQVNLALPQALNPPSDTLSHTHIPSINPRLPPKYTSRTPGPPQHCPWGAQILLTSHVDLSPLHIIPGPLRLPEVAPPISPGLSSAQTPPHWPRFSVSPHIDPRHTHGPLVPSAKTSSLPSSGINLASPPTDPSPRPWRMLRGYSPPPCSLQCELP